MSIENNELPNNPTIQSETIRPFRKFCTTIMTIGSLPSSYQEAMSYQELLLWLCDYLENTVIPAFDNNANAIQELQNLYVELKDYCDNYFTNLDVQEEINQKLDDMVQKGELDPLLKNIFNGFNKSIENQNNLIEQNTNNINTLNQRVNQLSSLEQGSTTGDAELQDIRTAFDGTIYETAGDSVRNQIKNLIKDTGNNYYIARRTTSALYKDLTITIPKGSLLYFCYKDVEVGDAGAEIDYMSFYGYTQDDETSYTNLRTMTKDDVNKFFIIKAPDNYVKIRMYIHFTSSQGQKAARFIFGNFENNSILSKLLPLTDNRVLKLPSISYVIRDTNISENADFSIYDFNKLYNFQVYFFYNCTVMKNSPEPNLRGLFFSIPFSNLEVGVAQFFINTSGKLYYRISVENNSEASWTKWLSPKLDNDKSELNLSMHTAKIFQKVCCVGDSYTAGYIVNPEGEAIRNNENYAWPHYMSLITGNQYINCGISGATSKTWQENNDGLEKAKNIGVVQAYLVGLGINDADSTIGLPVGNIEDIGTENETFYAQYSKLLRELHNISSQAKIFVMTMPTTETKYTKYNTAILEIANSYKDMNVFPLDLANFIEMYTISSITNDAKSGHYTAIGYEQFAENLEYILSDYINNNITEFQDVAFLPYDN